MVYLSWFFRKFLRVAQLLMIDLDLDLDSKEARKQLLECWAGLGWDHALRLGKSNLPAQFPLSYRLF